MRFISIILAALTLSAHAARQPNIVLIIADDLGHGDVGYQGGGLSCEHSDSLCVTPL